MRTLGPFQLSTSIPGRILSTHTLNEVGQAYGRTKPEQLGNARLMAEAPAMLAMLERIHALLVRPSSRMEQLEHAHSIDVLLNRARGLALGSADTCPWCGGPATDCSQNPACIGYLD